MQFLEQMSKIFEIVVFTASHQSYADTILNYIDKGRKLVHHRLYRQHCVPYGGNVYIKDLRVLCRDLKNVLIVDNAPYSFASQIDNGYPISPFYDNPDDSELTNLATYMQTLESADDIRTENRARFRLREITETNICEYAKYYQHTYSDVSATEQSCESLNSFGDETPNFYEKVKKPLCHIQSLFAELFK